jgi:hypothetical protein
METVYLAASARSNISAVGDVKLTNVIALDYKWGTWHDLLTTIEPRTSAART